MAEPGTIAAIGLALADFVSRITPRATSRETAELRRHARSYLRRTLAAVGYPDGVRRGWPASRRQDYLEGKTANVGEKGRLRGRRDRRWHEERGWIFFGDYDDPRAIQRWMQRRELSPEQRAYVQASLDRYVPGRAEWRSPAELGAALEDGEAAGASDVIIDMGGILPTPLAGRRLAPWRVAGDIVRRGVRFVLARHADGRAAVIMYPAGLTPGVARSRGRLFVVTEQGVVRA